MIRFSPDHLLRLGREMVSRGEYGDALRLISEINTREARTLKGSWSYQYGKQLVSAGSYRDAKESFAVAVQYHTQPSIRTLAQKRNELLNRILNGETEPVINMTSHLATINISEAAALPPEAFAPLISFVGCPAAYRSGFDPASSDPLSSLIRTVKQESGDPIVADERVRAIKRVGEILAAYAYVETPVLRDADLLVPVPPDLGRLAGRGYSVPLILAARVAVSCAIPAYTNLIETAGPLQDLRTLPRWARAGAVQDAYDVTDKAAMLDSLHVVVVDDVLTSGATLNEVAMVLRDYGCRRISGLVLAHTEWSG